MIQYVDVILDAFRLGLGVMIVTYDDWPLIRRRRYGLTTLLQRAVCCKREDKSGVITGAEFDIKDPVMLDQVQVRNPPSPALPLFLRVELSLGNLFRCVLCVIDASVRRCYVWVSLRTC